MKNLAGVKEADIHIQQELAYAQIESAPWTGDRFEVPFTRVGLIGEHFLLYRAWRYWVAFGPVPLHVALPMYEHPLGKDQIRVSGHCGGPPPEYPLLARFHSETGKELWVPREKDLKLLQSMSPNVQCWWEYKFHSVETQEEYQKGVPFVMSYHIDSQSGLLLYAQMIQNEIADPESPIHKTFPEGFTLAKGHNWVYKPLLPPQDTP